MRSVNKVIIIGNVVKDPVWKEATSWHNFTSFVIATNREWASMSWDAKSLVEFHKVVAWWKLADLCSKHIRKWKFIYIEWYLKTRSWEEDWIKLYRTEIVAQDMIMLNKRWEFTPNEEQQEPNQEKPYRESPRSNNPSPWMDLHWEDI